MSETRTTRHHHTNCAIHGTLVNGKLRDCTCTAAATPPTPDRAAVREALVDALCAAGMTSIGDGQRAWTRLAHALKVETSEDIADALLRPAPLPADVRAMVERERAAWIDGAAWASMDNDEISVGDIEAAANEKFGPGAAPSDEDRMDWLAQQATPHHGVILCASSQPNEPWASVQRVDQFHNPHKVQWCVEGGTLRDAIDRAMAEVPTLTLAPDDPERDRSLAAVSRPAEARGEPVAWGLTFLGILQTDAVYPTKGYAERELADRNARTPHDTDNRRLVHLYAHPAPSGGEAAPRPEPGEPSEAMVEAGVEGWIAAINDSYSLARMEHEVSRHEIVGHILRAALAAREGA